MSESLLPGNRPITGDELRLIRDMHASGRSLDDIARAVPNLAADHVEATNRLAGLLAPARKPVPKQWQGRRR